MPKKSNITSEQIAGAAEKADELYMELIYLADEVRAGRCDEIAKPIDLARKFSTLARAAADIASMVLTRKAMDDDRAELEATIRARVASDRG